jgi:hypothetical protein
MHVKPLSRYLLSMVLLTEPIVLSSPHCVRDFVLEGLLPSKTLHSTLPLMDFFPKCNHRRIVKRIKNGGLFVKKIVTTDFHDISAVKNPKLLRRPPLNFSPENIYGVSDNRIDERALFVRENRQLEGSQKMYKTTGSKLGIFGKKDRRIAFTKQLLPPFRSIALLRINYFVFPGEQIVFYGTGFRNKFNQLVTTGRNLMLEEKIIKDYCVREGIALKDYSFKKNNCTVDVIFGARRNSLSTLRCSYITQICARYARLHPKRDFCIIQLPQKDCRFLDENVGAVDFTSIPDSPNDIGKSVMLADYARDITQMQRYFGKIKKIDKNGIVFYTADTIPCNSGLPGFLLNEKSDEASVCFVHSHQVQKLNAGEKIDNDLLSFMMKYSTVKKQ